MGGDVGSDHRGRHVQANPISPSWDVFGLLWLLRGWLARSMYGASSPGVQCVPVLMPVWHCFVCGIAVAQYAGLSSVAVGLRKSQRETLHLLLKRGRCKVSVRVKGWMVKHLFVGST